MKIKDRYLVTGGTGLIGSSLINKLVEIGADITCPVRSMDKVHAMFEKRLEDSVRWIETPIDVFLKDLSVEFDYIIHCASPTASKYFVDCPVETLSFSWDTTSMLLDYARRNAIKGMVYLSSLESYGTVLEDSYAISEEYQGYVNPMETRSSYNVAKRMCECLCHAYAKEYNVPVKVIRLTQTVSPHISRNDMRVFAQFARYAAKGEDIELHTEGLAARQYIHIDDAITAILCVLFRGEAGEVYNAAREDSYISVRDLAQFVQDSFNRSGKVVINLRDDMGYAPLTRIKLNTNKLRSLGWEAKYGLYEMFEDLIIGLRNVQ